jgi:alkaline phosphatase D
MNSYLSKSVRKLSGLQFIIVLALAPVLLIPTCKWESRGGNNYGVFAPEDAWLKGDSLPYYGSENEWSRRMFEKGAADRYYKRRGQRQILAILDGKPELAVKYCQQRLRENEDDPEIYYMLTLAYSALGQLNESEAAMEKALALGMPFGRFIAGPRELIRPIVGGEVYQQHLSNASPLVHGPMLGDLTATGARCWVRTAGESSVKMSAWRVSEPSHLIESADVSSTEGKDFTAVMKLTGLEPGSSYYYNILINGAPVFIDDETPRFTTREKDGTPGTFRIAFGGGAGYNPKAEKIWTCILDRNPDALLLLGDNVYVDMPEMPGPFHDYTYYRRQSRPEYRSLISRVPVYSIWDDHDAGIDDIWMGPYLDKPDWKLPMVKHYQQNWVNPGYGSDDWPGCWFSFIQGDIEFFMLDGRTYRTNPFGPYPTMLGPVQKEWLLGMLGQSTARIKVLVSPVPWNYRAKPGSHDTWDGFREERDEIFGFISREDIGGIVLMSADRHRSEAWEIEWEGKYPIYEFLSSRLTNMHFHDTVPGAIYSYNDPQSFGLLTINTETKTPEVSFEIVNVHGELVYENTFIIGQP